jgi:hypothetical protein
MSVSDTQDPLDQSAIDLDCIVAIDVHTRAATSPASHRTPVTAELLARGGQVFRRRADPADRPLLPRAQQ